MAKISFYLKNPDSNELSPIKMYFRYREQTINFSTGEAIQPNHWNTKDQKVLPKFAKKYPDLQNKLDEYKEVISGIYRRLEIGGETISNEIIRKKFNDYYGQIIEEKHTLISFIEWYLEQAKTNKTKSTITGYKGTLRHLKEFEKHSHIKLSFDKINVDFYLNFIDYLKEKQFKPNTIGKLVKNIKVFLNQATERGINKNMEYKSHRFKVLHEETDAIYLNEDELQKLADLDLTNNTRLEKVRDLFLVGCYTGLRFSDLSLLKKDHLKNGKISIKMQKTGDTVVIPLHPVVSDIMKKYKETQNSLPPAMSNQKMNDYLKEIGKLAEINEPIMINETKGILKVETMHQKYTLISTHTARRSFATNLFLQNFPTLSIRKITGHKSEASFFRYIKMDGEQSASRLEEHWNNQAKLKKVV
ncbi:MAG: site-specific integrase [Bacteroidia bacterium]